MHISMLTYRTTGYEISLWPLWDDQMTPTECVKTKSEITVKIILLKNEYTLSLKNGHIFIFWIIVSKLTDLVIFGKWNRVKILHQQLIDLPASPVSCSHCTLENKKNHFSTILFVRTSDCLRYFRIKRTVTLIMNLPITTEKCHRTTLCNAKLTCLMECILFPSKRRWLWKGELCCVAIWLSGKQYHIKCSPA